MSSSRLAIGIRIGFVVAATTTGVIVGLGLRHASAMQPFLLAGRASLAGMTGVLAPPLLATILGFAVHAVWMLLWGVCFSVVATPLRGIQQGVAAVLFAGIAGVLVETVVPGALGAGAIATQTRAQTVFLLVLFALSLLAGMRLARD